MPNCRNAKLEAEVHRRSVRPKSALPVTILDSIHDPAALFDSEWRCTALNSAAGTAAGVDEPVGQILWEMFPQILSTPIEDHLRRAMAARSYIRFEAYCPPAARWIEAEAYPAGDGLLLFARTADALQFDRAERVQHELKRSNEDLRRANRDLETFAYSASHDLQEPLRNVAIYSQLLQRKLGPLLDGDTSKLLDGILKGTRRMQCLVEDLLSYSRATRQAEGPAPMIDAGAVIGAIVQGMKAQIETTRACIVVDPLPRLRMQEIHLSQIFQNLISNALKYRSPASPLVRISAESREELWTFSVTDNGIGIDPQYRQQIFGLFKRLHTQEEFTGSGVGLSICERIVEQYGGRIWADGAAEGSGSVFRFTLPDAGR